MVLVPPGAEGALLLDPLEVPAAPPDAAPLPVGLALLPPGLVSDEDPVLPDVPPAPPEPEF